MNASFVKPRYEKDKFEQKYYGHYGGLTSQEMEMARNISL
jgi:hypothetical protein